VFTLHTLPACEEPFDDGVGQVAAFSLHAGVAARAHERKKLERLSRYISRPAVSEKRLSLTLGGRDRVETTGLWPKAYAATRSSPMALKTARTSGGGAMHRVLYASTMGSHRCT